MFSMAKFMEPFNCHHDLHVISFSSELVTLFSPEFHPIVVPFLFPGAFFCGVPWRKKCFRLSTHIDYYTPRFRLKKCTALPLIEQLFDQEFTVVTTSKPFNSQDLISNSPYYLPYSSCDVSLENFVLDQLIIP